MLKISIVLIEFEILKILNILQNIEKKNASLGMYGLERDGYNSELYNEAVLTAVGTLW